MGGQSFQAGSLLATRLADNLAGRAAYEVLFAPSERVSLAGHQPTRHHVLLATLDNIKSRIHVLTPGQGGWTRTELAGLPDLLEGGRRGEVLGAHGAGTGDGCGSG